MIVMLYKYYWNGINIVESFRVRNASVKAGWKWSQSVHAFCDNTARGHVAVCEYTRYYFLLHFPKSHALSAVLPCEFSMLDSAGHCCAVLIRLNDYWQTDYNANRKRCGEEVHLLACERWLVFAAHVYRSNISGPSPMYIGMSVDPSLATSELQIVMLFVLACGLLLIENEHTAWL